MKKELLQLFAVPLLITKYENDLSKELAFVEKLKYNPNGMNGNFKSKDSLEVFYMKYIVKKNKRTSKLVFVSIVKTLCHRLAALYFSVAFS